MYTNTDNKGKIKVHITPLIYGTTHHCRIEFITCIPFFPKRGLYGWDGLLSDSVAYGAFKTNTCTDGFDSNFANTE
jgi:hypothetical protein